MILISSVCLLIAYFNLIPHLCQGEANYFSMDDKNNSASEGEMHDIVEMNRSELNECVNLRIN